MRTLLRLHELITDGVSAALPGKIRDDLRSVKRGGRVIFTAPPPGQLGFLLREFIEWFNQAAADKDISPIVAASICHLWFVWIHPFCDGNGRTARLLTTLLLIKKKSEGVKYFALSDYYNRHTNAYYDALEKTNICKPKVPAMNFHHDMSTWVSFFIASYLAQMREIRAVANRIFQLNIRVDHLRKAGLITERHSKALALLSSREKASYDELAEELGGVSRARVHQILKPLRRAHILVEDKIGSKIWFKLGSPEEEPDETIFKKKLKGRKRSTKKLSPQKHLKQAILPIFS